MRLHKIATLATGRKDPIWSISWCPTASILASAGSDCLVRLWASQTGDNKQTEVIQKDSEQPQEWCCLATFGANLFPRTLRCVAFNPRLPFLACGSFDSYVYTMRLSSNCEEGSELNLQEILTAPPKLQLTSTLEGHESEIKCVAFSSSGALLASCSRDRTIWLWELGIDKDDFESLSILEGHTQDVNYDNTVRMWVEDEYDWYCCSVLSGHSSTVWAASFDKFGERLVTVSDDRSVIFWRQIPRRTDEVGRDPSWETFCVLRDQHERAIYTVDWSHQSGLVVTGGGDDALHIYQENALRRNESSDVTEEQFAPHRDLADDSGEVSHHAEPFSIAAVLLNAHEGDINCVKWNPLDGYVFASCGDDGFIYIWQVRRDTP
ncbi:Probable cytosolic iron-sulfur protein assembly protein CIAO1 [Galdieria sulphuraria]|nr:Probable cytosolic iron-sulfur protein assembly protein CIAO1 [Galdieria sulphuraria]